VNEQILETLKAIRDNFGDGVFYNLSTAKNLMNDLAPQLRKERIQVGNFLEIGGYFQLKYADKTYAVVRTRLMEQLMDTYAVDEGVAIWVLNIFSVLLGYDISDNGSVYKEKAPKPKRPLPATERINPRPFIGDERRPLMTVPRPTFPNVQKKPAFTNWHIARRIAADYHSAAVLRNGQVKATGPNSDGQCNTNTYDWRDMVAVSAGANYTVGLRADGTVVGIGRCDFGQRNFTGWTDIIGISAGTRHTVGLRENGTLLAAGQKRKGGCNVSHWRNIVHVIAGQDCTFGIKKDGRVLVCGDNKAGDLDVSHLENVADIAFAAPGRILALLKDGTLARVGKENHMGKPFTHWRNIKQISAAPDYFAGLFEDGTVRLLAYFWQNSGIETATAAWKNIVAIAAGRYHILGWQSNGKLVAEMLHPDISRNKGQVNVEYWEL